jgi:hypothetical protein
MESRLAGLLQVINPSNASEKPEELEVMDDLEGEQQTLPNNSLSSQQGGAEAHMSQLQDTLLQASKGVTEGTDAAYQRCLSILLYVTEGSGPPSD